MVLQCKVFLIVALKEHSPIVSKKRTLIRRMKTAVSQNLNKSLNGLKRNLEQETQSAPRTPQFDRSRSNSPDLEVGGSPSKEVSQVDAMRLFDKIPFPEPRRVVYLRPRNDLDS